MAGSPGRDRGPEMARGGGGSVSSLPWQRPGILPETIAPMLPSPAAEPFDSTSHIFEVIWDGVRSLLFVRDGVARVQDAYGRDVTARYPELQSVTSHLYGSDVVLDGVIVCPDQHGRPDFARLHRRLSAPDDLAAATLADEHPVTFQAFDILYRNGASVMGQPLRRRKALLQQTVRIQAALTVPDIVEREGVAFFEAARAHGLPGIIAKQAAGTYLPGARVSSWLTMRVFERDKFVIGGCTLGRALRPGRPARVRGPFDSLLLGQYDAGDAFRFVGEVEGPFDRDVATALTNAMDTLATRDSPFTEEPTGSRLIFWCRPELVASVRFSQRTPKGTLRFPVFDWLRPDTPAAACRLPGAPVL